MKEFEFGDYLYSFEPSGNHPLPLSHLPSVIEISKLRREGVVGWCVGCLPGRPLQVASNALPALYSPTEHAMFRGDVELSEDDSLLIRVLQLVHGMGFVVTSGLKYGAQWCVYAGDPFLFHSFALLTILFNAVKPSPYHSSPSEIPSASPTKNAQSPSATANTSRTSVRWGDMIRLARLGNGVGKSLVISSVMDDERVAFHTLEWWSLRPKLAIENEKSAATNL